MRVNVILQLHKQEEKMTIKISSKIERLFIFDNEGNLIDSLVYDLPKTIEDYDELEKGRKQ
jgi:hypothetical protein